MLRYRHLKEKVYLLLDPTEGGTKWDRIINGIIVALILLNTLAVVLETVESIDQNYGAVFNVFETASVVIFSIEYGLRLWSCTANPKYSHWLGGRLRYVFSPGALVDLLAIVPAYLPMLFRADLRFIRLLRLVRFFRFFKLSRYMNASRVIGNVFRAKREELVLSMVITFFLIVIASSIMYFVEHDAQLGKFSSIPETMWWSVATLTTVGYGDVFPITTWGKTLTAVISVLGIGMFALPAGILASGFSDEFKKNRVGRTCCPHCGAELP